MTQTASANKLRACDVANTARKLTDQQSRKRSHSAAFEAQHPPAFPCRICDIRYRCATSPACIRDISMHSSDRQPSCLPLQPARMDVQARLQLFEVLLHFFTFFNCSGSEIRNLFTLIAPALPPFPHHPSNCVFVFLATVISLAAKIILLATFWFGCCKLWCHAQRRVLFFRSACKSLCATTMHCVTVHAHLTRALMTLFPDNDHPKSRQCSSPTAHRLMMLSGAVVSPHMACLFRLTLALQLSHHSLHSSCSSFFPISTFGMQHPR